MKFTHLLIVFAMGLLLSFPAMATYTITDTPSNGVVSVDDSGVQSVVSHAPADDGLVYSALPGVDVPCNRCIQAGDGDCSHQNEPVLNRVEAMGEQFNRQAEYDSVILTFAKTWARVIWSNLAGSHGTPDKHNHLG